MKYCISLFILLFLPFSAVAGVPQSCHDGLASLEKADSTTELLLDMQDAIDAFSKCMNSGALSYEDLAATFYNRGLAYFFIYEDNGDFEALMKAHEDAEEATKLNSKHGNAFCLKGQTGQIIGYDLWDDEMVQSSQKDIEKGKTLGGDDKICDFDWG